jgi:hypothetical protein
LCWIEALWFALNRAKAQESESELNVAVIVVDSESLESFFLAVH